MLNSKFSLSRHFEYANKQITYHFWLCKSIVPNISHHFVPVVCATYGRSTYVALLCVRRLSNWFKIYFISLNYDLIVNICCTTLCQSGSVVCVLMKRSVYALLISYPVTVIFESAMPKEKICFIYI